MTKKTYEIQAARIFYLCVPILWIAPGSDCKQKDHEQPCEVRHLVSFSFLQLGLTFFSASGDYKQTFMGWLTIWLALQLDFVVFPRLLPRIFCI